LDIPADERIGWFDLADQIVQQLLRAEPTVARLLTAIRLATEAGRRDNALKLARDVVDGLHGRHGPLLFEPYLLPFAAFEAIEKSDDDAVWIHSLCLVALEKLRSWSSFFTAAQSTHLWNELRNYPWWRQEAERMLAILGTLWAEAPEEERRQALR